MGICGEARTRTLGATAPAESPLGIDFELYINTVVKLNMAGPGYLEA